MEGIKKIGGQCKRWRDDEAEEGLTILGIRNRQPAVTDRHQWRKIVLEGLVRSGLQCLRRRRSSSIGGSSSGSDGSSFRGGVDVIKLSSGSSCFSSDGGGGGTTASVV